MGVAAIYQLFTPWSDEDIADLQFEQAADVMVFTHPSYPVYNLTRYEHDRWTLDPAGIYTTAYPPANIVQSAGGIGNNPPTQGTGYADTEYAYVVTTIDAETGQESLPSAAAILHNDLTIKGNHNNIGWDYRAGAERYQIYKRGQGGGAWGYIGTTDLNAFVDDNIAPDFSQSFPVHRNPFDSPNNYPASVAFWQQRSVFGRTYNKPNGIFTSQSGNLFNFNVARPIADSDAVTFAVTGRRVNAVLHLVPLKSLIVFTTDSVFSIKGANGVFSPTDIDITPEGYRAASKVRPVVIDDIAMFSTAKGASIRTLGYQFEADGYKGNDLTVFAPHLFRDITIKDMAWSEFPGGLMHAIGSDGDVRSLTWQAEQDVWGWSVVSTAGQIESVCTVSENGEDVAYFVIRRYINGAWNRYIEYLSSPRWVKIEDANYLDSSRTYDGPPVTTLRGLDHLEGEIVTALTDGAVQYKAYKVVNGTVTLRRPASKAVVGLSYESWVRTLPPNMETQEGTAKGKAQTVAGIDVLVQQSRGIEGAQGKNLAPGQMQPVTSDYEIQGDAYEIKTRNGEPMGEPTELYSGWLRVPVDAGDWRDATVVLRQRHPLPMHVINIVPNIVVGG